MFTYRADTFIEHDKIYIRFSNPSFIQIGGISVPLCPFPGTLGFDRAEGDEIIAEFGKKLQFFSRILL